MQPTRKIKVVQAIRQGQVGGGETHILSLVQCMNSSRFEPVVLSFTGGQMIEQLEQMGIRHHVIPSEKAMDFAKWRAVQQWLVQEQADVVHVHGTRANSNVYWAAKSLGLPIVYTIHGWSFHEDQSWLTRQVRIGFEKWITRRVNCNISVSLSNQETGRRYIPGFCSQVVNNGIDMQVFHPAAAVANVRLPLGIPAGACVIGFIGRMTEQKDPLTLIRAFALALQQNAALHLLMVGEGTLCSQAVQLVKDLGLENAVTFEGFRSDVPAVLQAIDIYCLPSLWEGLPIGLLEAMAMQKAVAATAVDGSKEIIRHGENGLIIPAGQPEALAAALILLAGDASLRNRLGIAARQTVGHSFDSVTMTRHIESVYETVWPPNKQHMKQETIPCEYNRIADKKRVEFIARVLKQSLTPDACILDVGCGNGVISRHLGRLGFQVTGIDVSEKTIEKARALNNLANVTFLQKSAEELVAAGKKYDAIVCSEVLEHLNDPGSLIKVLRESLQDNGKLIITVPNGNGPRELLVTRPVLSMRRKNNWMWKSIQRVKRLMGYKGTTVQSDADNLDHIQFFSKSDLEKLSSSHQFAITQFGKANFIEDVFPFSFVAKRVRFLQKIDCLVADLLPTRFTGGFFTVWEKR